MTHPTIAAALTARKTHAVVTTYACGATRQHDCRNAMSAQTYADGERRKIGRNLIDRTTSKTVRVCSVEVIAL